MTEASSEESPPTQADDLLPAEEHVSPEDDTITVNGQTFEQHLRSVRASSGMPGPEDRRLLWEEFQAAAQREARDQAGGDDDLRQRRDEDGAIHFDDDDGGHLPVLPPDVPVPSEEMIRTHRLSGHARYKPWCSSCVRGACNAPAHRARAALPVQGAVPEVHADYAFSRTGRVMLRMCGMSW